MIACVGKQVIPFAFQAEIMGASPITRTFISYKCITRNRRMIRVLLIRDVKLLRKVMFRNFDT